METRQRGPKVPVITVSKEENTNNGMEYKTLIQEKVPEKNELTLHIE